MVASSRCVVVPGLNLHDEKCTRQCVDGQNSSFSSSPSLKDINTLTRKLPAFGEPFLRSICELFASYGPLR